MQRSKMKLTPKQELELGAELQKCLDHCETVKLEAPSTSAQAVFISNLLSSFDKDGVPGALRIMLRLQSLDMKGVK